MNNSFVLLGYLATAQGQVDGFVPHYLLIA